MPITALEVYNIRNLSNQCIQLSPGLNFFYGHNGAGKSAILESIYILGAGKSFRASQLNAVVSHNKDLCQIGGRVLDQYDVFSTTLKCVKQPQEKAKFLINDDPASSIAVLAQMLPVQLLNLDAYHLLADPPEERRRWLDWLMFHVEPSFYPLWREYHRLLKQRNASLRFGGSRSDLPHWTALLALAGMKLHEAREKLVRHFMSGYHHMLENLPGVFDLNMSYHPGWDDAVSLEEALFASEERDMSLGYTHAGPHRADLKIKMNEKSASQILSTGQQKTFVTSLQLAQVSFMIEQTGKCPVLLIDDLPSELDENARRLLGDRLSTLNAQICLTSVDSKAFNELGLEQAKMFHVEHGVIAEVC